MKILQTIILIFIFFLVSFSTIFAHPADTSNLTIYIRNDARGEKIDEDKAIGYVTFNWLQMSAFTKQEEDPIKIFNSIQKYDNLFYNLVAQNIKVSNSKAFCEVNFNRYPEGNVNSVIADGLRYSILAKCEQPITEIKIENTTFKDTILTQTNNITLMKGFEVLKRSDKGELEYTLEDMPIPVNSQTTNILSKLQVSQLGILKDINNIPSIMIMMSIFLMGVIHSFEGGHNKIILGSLIINRGVSINQALVYTLIFTLTHMSDIILLAFFLLIFNRYIDIYKLLPNIQIYTVIALITLSTYSIIKELMHLKQHINNHEHNHNHDNKAIPSNFRSQLAIAFISGLAPCITGWSIFMLIFSSGRLNLILPGVIAFGLGIFSVLSLFTLIISHLKSKLSKRLQWLQEYNGLISSILVLTVSIIQTLIILNK